MWYFHLFFRYKALIVPERQRAQTVIEEKPETEHHLETSDCRRPRKGRIQMLQPLLELKHDHEAIESVVEAMSAAAERLQHGEELSHELVQEFSTFMHTFADACHHAKEEKYLFPLVEKKHIGDINLHLRRLEEEHLASRTLLSRFDQLSVAYLSKRPGARESLVQVMNEIAELYRRHIWEEDHVFLPLLEGTLTPVEQRWLRDKFSEVEWYIGLDVHRRYEVLADKVRLLAEPSESAHLHSHA
jgi:hemerythrin-like domain-containing protein